MRRPTSLSALSFIQQITVELSSSILVIWGQCSQQYQKPTAPDPRRPPSPAHPTQPEQTPPRPPRSLQGSGAERRPDPRPLDGARARSIAPSRRSPGAHRSLLRASGSRQAPPRSCTFAYQMRTVCRIFFSRGGSGLTIRKSRGKGEIEDPAGISKLWEEPPQCFSAWAMAVCPFGAGPELRRVGPRP